MTPTPWILKSTSGTFATSASVSALTASQNDILNASTYVSSHSGALSISANGVALLQNWDGSTPSAINITGTGGGFSPTVAVTPIQAVGTTPSGVTVTFTYGDEGSQTTSYSLYDGVSGVSGSQGKTGRSLWVSDLTAVAPTTEHTCGGSAYTIHYEDETYEPQAYTITAWNGNSGTNGVNGTSPTVSTENITGSENRTGTKITFNYGDNLSQTTSYSAWNGKDGDAGSLPSAPANPGDYLLQKTTEGTSWKPYTEPTAGTQVSGENGISARKVGDVTYVGLDAETIDITGAGSVSVTSNAQGQLVISGKEVSVPENVVTSGTEQQTGAWCLSGGKWANATSLISMYKTSKPEIARPVDSIVYNCHTSLADAKNDYNYIEITAGSDSYKMYSLVKPFKSSLSAQNGISADFTNDGAWNFGIDTSTLDASSAYCWTTTGWSAFNVGGGSEFTGVTRDESLSGNGATSNLGVNTAYLTDYYLPLSGGTVTGRVIVNGDSVEARSMAPIAEVVGDAYDIFKVTRTDKGSAILGVSNLSEAFIKCEQGDNNGQLQFGGADVRYIYGSTWYNIPYYSTANLTGGDVFGITTAGSWAPITGGSSAPTVTLSEDHVISSVNTTSALNMVDTVTASTEMMPQRICVVTARTDIINQHAVISEGKYGTLFFVVSALNT